MLEKIKEMVAEQLNVDAAEITEVTSFKDDLGCRFSGPVRAGYGAGRGV